MRQRTMSIALIICMVMSFFMPFTAFAAEAATPTDATLGESGASCETTTSTDEDGGISIQSGWEGDGNEFFTKIRLTALDRDGNPIEGAVYGLYRKSDDSLVEYLTTNSYGIAESSDVPVDEDYYLLEYSAPEGFLPNPERKDIDLTEICAPSRVDVTVVYDPIAGYIKVIKVDEYGEPLAGIGFYIYRNDTWELVDTIETGSDGTAISTLLPYGWYELYEYSYPDNIAGGGYTSILVDEDGATHEITITNYYASGSARIYKMGSDDKSIDGAVFSIHNADTDEWIEDITTGSGGYAYSSSLPLGDYYAVEKSVPAPYVLDAEKQYFSLTYDGHTAYLDIVNQREGESGKIKVIKTDDSGNPLSGVVFGIYRAWNGKKMAELITSDDGIAEYSLAPDDYYLIELSGKDGYEMVSGQIPFTIDGSGATIEKTIENPKIRIFGKVKVLKKDDAGSPIEGVRFGVYCDAGNLLEEIVTGSDGTATSGVLNEGSGYYLMELEGVDGYLSDADARYPFDISTNGTIVPVNVENPRITGGIKIIKDDGNGNPLVGVVFGIYKNDNKIAELTTGEDGTVISGALYYGTDYELRELATVDGYELITTPIPFSILEQDVIVEIPFSNPLILGSVTVYKVDAEKVMQDEHGEPDYSESYLSGAVFGIYNAKGQKVAEITIGEDGRGSYDGLPKSGYYLKELVAPEGFVLHSDMIPFEISEQGEHIEIIVENAKGYGDVQILKSGEDSEPLAGVVFEVFRASTDAKIMELTTGDDGIVTQELPLGSYYLTEKSTVDGYRLLTGRITFTITAEGQTVELSISNQKEPAPEGGIIRLIKKSTDDGKLLPGAVFGIYRVSDDEKVGELVTGSDGTAISVSLPEIEKGYYLMELTPPAGYKTNTEKNPVVVKNGETVEITVENQPDEQEKPGTLTIIKAAKGSGERLQGAVFGVYRKSDDGKVGELTTDKNGKASMELPEGDYYLKELTAPAGFSLLPDTIPFNIKSETTRELVIENDPLVENPGTLKITKRAEGTNDRLEGVVFGIYRKSDDGKVMEIKTDKYGEASCILPAGDYYLKELATVPGYQLLSDTIAFTITKDKTAELTISNKKLPPGQDSGKLLIIKKAAGTGRLLEDAVFGVYKASNNEKVMELTTNSKGEATAELPAGDYYLVELRAPASFVAEPDRIPFKVKVDTAVRIEVTNTQGQGTLKLIKVDDAGKPLAGGVFILYRNDGTAIAELTSRQDGTAVYELPVGSYYIVEKTAPASFKLDTQRHSFTIENGKTAEVKVVNHPLTGTVEIYFKHVSDGRELHTMVSYTDKVGADYIKWMRANKYENMQITGYNLIRTDYPATLVLVDGKLIVTLWYDSPGNITIPKTGETPPYLNYALAAVSWAFCGFCGIMLYRMKNKSGEQTA